MTLVCMLPNVEFGQNDYRVDAPHFTEWIKKKNMLQKWIILADFVSEKNYFRTFYGF